MTMAKKELCIMAYVYGEHYKSYIPFFVYSVWKTYPWYDVVIYLDEKLPTYVEQDLEALNQKGCDNFRILLIDGDFGFGKKAIKSPVIQRSLRWFNYPEFLKEYSAVYVGDIDIFICPEKMSIYQQHEEHSKYLGVPFSNYARYSYPQVNYRNTIKRILIYGPKVALKNIKRVPERLPRLSGLHFFFTDPCLDILKDAVEEEIKEINSIFDGTHAEYNIAYLDDETILYWLYEKAGFRKLPPQVMPSIQLMTNENPSTLAFRPHHGVHLGIWRAYVGGKFDRPGNEALVTCDLYRQYYQHFKKVVLKDEGFTFLIEGKNTFAKTMFNRMIDFYDGQKN